MFERAKNYLSDYIRIDTTVPPGNTGNACDFLGRVFSSASIPFKTFESAPGKVNFLAKMEGSGEKAPIIFLNHLDVVPADPGKWNYPPFGGKIEDGFLYGRGTIDMKCLAVFEMMAFLHLKENNITPNRDVYFLGTCDEEIGGELGAKWMAEHVKELQEAEAVFNEGTPVLEDQQGRVNFISVDVSEKVMFQLRLHTSGVAGHASLPHSQNPNVKLVNALHAVVNCHPPYHITHTVKEYFKNRARIAPENLKNKYENIEESLRNPVFVREFVKDSFHNAIVSNTISLTVLRGGGKVNVIPSESEAFVDIRLLPGVDPGVFQKYLEKVINNPEIKIECYHSSEIAPESSITSDAYNAIKGIYEDEFKNVLVAPGLFPACTDSRFFRSRGIDSYSFMPIKLPESEYKKLHGIDERISIENINRGTRLTTELLLKMAT